jgi:hypothetical protein
MVLNRMNSGTLLALVIEPDEALAVEACRMAGEAIAPKKTKVLSVLDETFMDKLIEHRANGQGVLIVSDLLRIQGQTIWRFLREFALTVKAGPPYPRIILVETPGVDVPPGLKGDIEYITTDPPTRDELKQELEQFLTDQSIKLSGNGEERSAIADACAGMARHEVARLLARSYVETKKLDVEWLRNAKATRIREQSGKALTFIDVADVPQLGGSELMVEWLARKKKAFASQKARDYGLSEPRGVLLVGVPGTGKSLTPKNIARSWQVPLVRLDMGAIFGSLVGQSEAQMRQALKSIEACSPCVLWVDEIEKGLGGTKGGSQGDSGVGSRVLGTFLTWLQENKKPVFVVATANSVTSLPPELLRKGRLDEIFFVDLPDQTERETIAKIHVERKKRDPKVLDIKEVATFCNGFSGAEIEQVIADALDRAFFEDREVTLADVAVAAKETTPLSVIMSEDIGKLRQWAKEKARPANKRGAKSTAQPEATGKPFRMSITKQTDQK